jgi:hypothetical protein
MTSRNSAQDRCVVTIEGSADGWIRSLGQFSGKLICDCARARELRRSATAQQLDLGYSPLNCDFALYVGYRDRQLSSLVRICVIWHRLDRVRHGLQTCSEFPRIDLASDMRLENRIGCRVTKNALKAIGGIGLVQGFPSPRHFCDADFRIVHPLVLSILPAPRRSGVGLLGIYPCHHGTEFECGQNVSRILINDTIPH